MAGVISKLNALCVCSVLFFLCLVIGCARPVVREDAGLVRADEAKTRSLLNTVRNINRNAPDSLHSRFSVEGLSGRKRFSSLGELVFSKNPRLLRISLTDAVFRSSLSTIVQDGDRLTLYFPGDKSMFLDSMRSIEIKKYTRLDIDLRLIYPLITGQIPLLENYSVRRGLSPEEGRALDAQHSFLILENREFFQTISFKGDVPDKILFIHKDTGRKIEVYLEKPAMSEGMLHYSRIRLNLVSSGDAIAFGFSGVRFNQPVDAKSVLALPDRSGLKVVDMTAR